MMKAVKQGAHELELSRVLGDDDVEDLDKDDKSKGDDDDKAAAPQTPDVVIQKDTSKGPAPEGLAFDQNRNESKTPINIDDKAEVNVIPGNLLSEQLGTDDDIGEIHLTEHSEQN